MFIFVVQTLQKKWNKICMKQLAGGKHMENNCFLRTFKFEILDTFFDCLMLQWEEDQNRKYKLVEISTVEIAV
jgi:hypothetical protein